MVQWIRSYETIFPWLTAASIVIYIASFILVPFFIIRIPPDYFAAGKDHKKRRSDHHPVIRGALVIARNVLGYIFLAAGTFMLVLPGQGLLTIFAGIMLLDFRGKHRLERWIVSRRPVLQSINWIRLRAGRAPLTLEG